MATAGTTAQRVWGAVLGLLLILAFLPGRWGGRFYGPPLRSIVHVLLAPVSRPLVLMTGWARQSAPGKPPPLGDSIEALSGEIREKDGRILALEKEVRELRRDNAELQRLKELTQDRVIPFKARVLAFGSDPASRTIQILGGSRDGLREGMAAVQGPNLLGRIVQAGLTTSAMQPLTAPRNLVDVVFAPAVLPAEGLAADRRHPVQLRSAASDVLTADDVDRAVPIEKGDLARLSDETWPPTVQGMIVGQVIEVRDHPDDPLRKQVKVRPLVSAYQLEVLAVFKPAPAPVAGSTE